MTWWREQPESLDPLDALLDHVGTLAKECLGCDEWPKERGPIDPECDLQHLNAEGKIAFIEAVGQLAVYSEPEVQSIIAKSALEVLSDHTMSVVYLEVKRDPDLPTVIISS